MSNGLDLGNMLVYGYRALEGVMGGSAQERTFRAPIRHEAPFSRSYEGVGPMFAIVTRDDVVFHEGFIIVLNPEALVLSLRIQEDCECQVGQFR
jgi:hypothetical protein